MTYKVVERRTQWRRLVCAGYNIEDLHFFVRCLRYRFRTEKLALKTSMLLNLKGAIVVGIGAHSGIYSFRWYARSGGIRQGLPLDRSPRYPKAIQSAPRS